MAKRKIMKDSQYDEQPIQTAKANGNGSIKDILEGYYSRLKYMTEKHKQISVMHLVVTTPEGVDPKKANHSIGRSINGLKKNMSYRGIDAQIGWVREESEASAKEGSERLHFHVGIIANGSKTQSAVKHAEQLDRIWTRQTGDPSRSGYVHYCKPKIDEQNLTSAENSTVIKIRRNMPDADKQFTNAFNWLSYPAQNVQKDTGPYRSKGFAFTRIPSILKDKT